LRFIPLISFIFYFIFFFKKEKKIITNDNYNREIDCIKNLFLEDDDGDYVVDVVDVVDDVLLHDSFFLMIYYSK